MDINLFANGNISAGGSSGDLSEQTGLTGMIKFLP